MNAPTPFAHELLAAGRTRAGDPDTIVTSLRALARAMLAITDGDSAQHGETRRAGERRRLGALAEALHRERARRDEFFSCGLFGEPAWDIMLDLYAAARASELRSVKSVCLASNVPEATAHRHIQTLVENGLVERRPDRTDRRRKYLSLTALGERKMHDYLATMPPLGDQGEDLIRQLILSA